MRIGDILLEYDRERARQALGDGLWKAALRDQFRLWFKPLDQLKDLKPLSISPNEHKFIMDVFDRPNMQRDVADRALQEIEAADPSTNKKYTQWMARQFATGNVAKLEDVVSTLADAVAKFHRLGIRRKLSQGENDINRYKTAEQLYDTMDRYEDVDAPGEGGGQADKVYEDGDVTVIVPRDRTAACAYGRRTRWCTAATSSYNAFDSYNSQGPLYIVIPKNPKQPETKYQLHFESGQFMDEHDEPIDIAYLLQEQYPRLGEYFMSQPRVAKLLGETVAFADDETLQKLSDDIWSFVLDKVQDVLSDLEANDDSYYRWLKDHGYVDEAGDIDWDKAPSYMEYNDDARSWEATIEEYAHPSPDDLRRMTRELVSDGRFDEDSIYQLEGYVAQNMRWQMRRDGMGDAIPDFIDKHLHVKRTSFGPRVEYVKGSSRSWRT